MKLDNLRMASNQEVPSVKEKLFVPKSTNKYSTTSHKFIQ